jgi:hypothetical protein
MIFLIHLHNHGVGKDMDVELHRGYTFLTTSFKPLTEAAFFLPDRQHSSTLSRNERLKFPKP